MAKNNSGKKSKPKSVSMKAARAAAGHAVTADPEKNARLHKKMMAAMKDKKKKK